MDDTNPIEHTVVDEMPDFVPVEGPEPDEATELLRALIPRLSQEDEEREASATITNFHAGIEDRQEWELRLAEWEDQYYGRTGDKDFPWPGASNFHVPITMMGVEHYKPRLVEAVLGQQPPVIAIPTTPAGEDKRDKVETVLNWQAMTQLKLETLVPRSAHLYLQPGTVYAKVTWMTDRRREKFIREFPAATPVPAIFESLFGTDQIKNLEQDGNLSWVGDVYTTPQGGSPLEVKITFKFLDEPASIQVLVDREVVTERPDIALPEPVDIIVPVKGGEDPGTLPWIQHRLWLSEDDLRRKVRQGRFYQDVVEDVIRAGATGDQPPTDSDKYKQSQDAAEGVEGDGASNARADQFEVLEEFCRTDIDGDGYEEEVIKWVSPRAPKKLLGWDYLKNVYAHGMRPIVKAGFLEVPFRWYSLSYAEMMRGVQDEINTIHNQRVDYATIQNLPFFFKRASATIPPLAQRVRPGEGVDVDNPQQDILFPKWGGSPAWGQQEEATVMQYGERLSGMNDLTMGRQPNRVGATRTASGTQTLLSESGLRAKIIIQNFQRFWTRVFEQVLALDQEYLPPVQEFRITGKQPAVIKVKDRSEIRGKYELRLASTAEAQDRGQMRDNAALMLQMVQSPLALQSGLIGRKGLRRAYELAFKSFGEDPSFWLEDIAPIRSPEEELMLFATGQYVPPVMGEDVQAHMVSHQEAAASPIVNADTKALIRRHMQETIQLAQTMMMAQQAPASPATGQQATNAQTGKQAQPPQPSGQPGRTSTNAGMPSGGANGSGR